MNRKNSITIINEYFSDNVGDQAIARGLKFLFSEAGYQVVEEGFSAASHIGKTEKRESTGSRLKLKMKQGLRHSVIIKSLIWVLLNFSRVIRAARNKDGFAVIGGGQLIMEKSNFAIAMLVWVVTLRFFGKKVYLLSVGMGEEFNKYEKALYAISFKLVHRIYLREIAGIERMKKIFGIDADYSADAAYALPLLTEVSDQSYIAVCVTDYRVYERNIEEIGEIPLSQVEYWYSWNNFIKTNVRSSEELKFMWTTETDKEETIQFIQHTQPEYSYTIFDEELSLDSVLEGFSKAKVVISGRMHGLILGHICGARPVPWLISKKIEHYSNEYLKLNPADLNLGLNNLVNELGIADRDNQSLRKGN